jgi:predicted transcriptional regulator
MHAKCHCQAWREQTQAGAAFADRLKAQRLAAGLRLMALAEWISVPHQRVCDYECGRTVPQWRTLVKLGGVLGVGLVGV